MEYLKFIASMLMSMSTRRNVARLVVFIFFCIGLYYYLTINLVPYFNQPVASIQSNFVQKFKLTASSTSVTVADVKGVIYFGGIRKATTSAKTALSIYSYNLDNQGIHPVVNNYPATSFDHGNSEYDIMTAFVASSTDPDKTQPVWYQHATTLMGPMKGVNGYHERDIAASPDHIHYAFSYQASSSQDGTKPDNWNIAILDNATGTVATITGGMKPHWLDGGTYLVYMKSDGLYRYTMSDHSSVPLFTQYQNLDAYNDFTVSPDGNWIILTIPSTGTVSVVHVTSAPNIVAAEIGSYQSSGERYRFPVISPDNKFYATTVVNDADYSSSTKNYSQVNVQIRPLLSVIPIRTIPIPNFNPITVGLQHWYNY